MLEQWQIEKANINKRLQQGEEEIIHLKQEKDMEIQQLVKTHKAQIDQLNVSLQVFLSRSLLLAEVEWYTKLILTDEMFVSDWPIVNCVLFSPPLKKDIKSSMKR